MPHLGEVAAVLSTAPPVSTVTATGSPFTWQAPDPGRLVVSGGTVSLLEVGRGGTFVSVGVLAGVVPVSRGDSVRVTYTVAPTMTYFKA